jgi:beta-N-acetylhexosaminidase
LDAKTAAFFAKANPWAFILFREACQTRAQVTLLCAELREAVGRDAVIWIDQEGGRVARLKPPEWPVWPAPARYGEVFAISREQGLEAVRLGHRLIAHELKSMGVDGDFAPVLDRALPGADKIVGDRALSDDVNAIASLGRAALKGLAEGGVVGCVKHMPGHGRAEADSHLKLPRVKAPADLLAADGAAFRALKEAPAAMTAHIVYEAWDAEFPATCSLKVISEVIRGEIGFDGLLMSDDIDMKALADIGDLAARAGAALQAGCDIVLQCSGDLGDMKRTIAGCGRLQGEALARATAAEAVAKRPAEDFDAEAGWARFKELLPA